MKLNREIAWLLEEKYFGQSNEKFDNDVRRLKAGEPLAYVIGFIDFLGYKIDLSKKPLIPRVETEFWVQKMLAEIENPPTPRLRRGRHIKCLDIFAGSGCIGVAVLKNMEKFLPAGRQAKVMFAEKDKALLGQIKINCEINSIDKKRYLVKQSDIFKNVTGRFDYIFANPPYIPATKKRKLQKSVINYEPHLALFGKEDGLFYIQKFLVKAKDFLTNEGKIFMEFDSPQKKVIEKLLLQYKYRSFEFHKDQYGRYRYVVVQ